MKRILDCGILCWLAAGIVLQASIANAQESTNSAASTEALAKAAQNPIANMISVPFQNNFNFGIGPNDATQWICNVQPVIPIKLNEDWNVITRTIVPIINQPSPAAWRAQRLRLG